MSTNVGTSCVRYVRGKDRPIERIRAYRTAVTSQPLQPQGQIQQFDQLIQSYDQNVSIGVIWLLDDRALNTAIGNLATAPGTPAVDDDRENAARRGLRWTRTRTWTWALTTP